MDKSKVIDKLNEILRWEWTGVAQYAQHSFIVRGLLREVYSKLFEDGAEESFGHAKKIGAKISAMGGVPTLERGAVKQSDDLTELLQFGLEFERGAVKHYLEALDLAADDRPLVVLLEEILLDEQEGVEHLEKLLHDSKSGAGSTGKKAVG
jgi:bacterioferritin